jgi:inhibitor of cysteine peptidase
MMAGALNLYSGGHMNSALLRIGLPLLALLLAVASACGGDDDDDDDDGDATPAATSAASPTAASGAPDEVQLTDADDGSTVALAVDGTLIVALPSNPSTGFAWSVTAPEPAGLELEGEPEYVPPGSTTPVVGAAGTQVFTFTATESGTSVLTLTYARDFEPGAEGEQTFTVTVEIE